MKKLLIIGALTLLLAGCNNKSTKEVTIELEGNPTTGYEWTCKIDKDVAEVSIDYKTKDESLMGSGGTYTIKLAALESGEAILTCTYKRSWEETESDSEKTYTVNVDKDKNIKVEEK